VPGPLDLPIALARELLHRSGALRVSVMVDRGDARPPAVVDCPRFAPVEVTEGDGEARALPHDAAAQTPLPDFPEVRQLPPFEVDAVEGTVAGTIGGLEMLARAVRDVAGLIGGQSTVAAEFETQVPGQTLGLAGRDGEPVVVLLGEDAFELDV
jgi:hypothetical protein